MVCTMSNIKEIYRFFPSARSKSPLRFRAQGGLFFAVSLLFRRYSGVFVIIDKIVSIFSSVCMAGQKGVSIHPLSLYRFQSSMEVSSILLH